MTLKEKAKQYLRKFPVAKKAYHRLRRFLAEQPAPAPSPEWNPASLRFITETKAKKNLQEFLESQGKLVFQKKEAVLISIVIVVYNRSELTFQCLKSLTSFDYLGLEVIVVDNASADDTTALMRQVDGIRYIQNKDNLHFLKGTNQGAAVATGKYILLLNNDTEVQPGALEAAVKNFEQNEKVGAVGAKLVLTDGSLQEAGSMAFQDGTCLGYGRGDDPHRAPYQFKRAVDFCSGAFLMLKRDLWLKLGGLDEQFSPAYYEEVDLCFRIWEQGLQVIYDPQVVIQHFEFASSKKPADAFALQIANQEKFRTRHERTLAQRTVKNSAAVLELRERREGKKQVLWIDERIPHPHYGSGYPRAQLLIRLLTELNCRVTLFPAIHVDGDETWRRVYDAVPREVEVMALDGYGPGHLQEFLRERRGMYDLIFVSRPETMREVRRLLSKDATLLDLSQVIYDAEAIFSLRDTLEAKVLGRKLDHDKLEKQKREELSLTNGVRTVMTVSEREAEEFRSYGCGDVRLISHAQKDYQTQREFDDRSGILFIGTIFGDGGPNFDSMYWFCSDVLPVLRAGGCNETVYIAGFNQSQGLKKFVKDGVEIVGAVAELLPWYERCRVFIAPTRFSAGIPLKVVEAASNGIPCVISTLLMEQLGADDSTFSVGRDAAGFADAVQALLTDATRWNVQQKSQYAFIKQLYSYYSLQSAFNNILKAA